MTPQGQDSLVSPRDANLGFTCKELDHWVGGWCKAFALKTGQLLVVNIWFAAPTTGEVNSQATALLRQALTDPGGQVHGSALLIGERDFDRLPQPFHRALLYDTVGEPVTVLLLDNDEEIRALITLGLERRHFRVVQAGTPAEAAQLRRHHPIEFLVADVGVLQPQAVEALRPIEAFQPKTRVLLISGHDRTTVEDCHEGLLAGREFLQKPFSPLLLATVLQQMAQRPMGILSLEGR